MKKYIIGTGGHSKSVMQLCYENKININGFISLPINNLNKKKHLGYKVFKINEVNKNSKFFIGIGDLDYRKQMFKFIDSNLKCLKLVSKKSICAKKTSIGEGTVIFSGAIININVSIGKNVIINTGCIIEHDVVIEDNCVLSPGVIVCGKSRIKKNTFIGAGAIIQNNLIIGENSIVGSGSNVVKNISNKSKVYGNPAR